MTTDVSPSPTAGVTSRLRTSPALLAAVGLYAAATGHDAAGLGEQPAVLARAGRGDRQRAG